MSTSIIALFCCLDDFAKTFEDWERHRLIDTGLSSDTAHESQRHCRWVILAK